MTKINILDSSIYNQISAGEVVENPASIIKELVENSIDAGAQNIEVYINDGGIKSIQVIDDGEGMEHDDLIISIKPHATSKIKEAKDLFTISTLGFRGEALASIAAVSLLELKSKYFQGKYASEILVKGGKIIEENICTLNKGTSIIIKSLFYNTPARFKFLKSKKSEENEITRLLSDFIFANPFVSFKYYIDNKLFYSSLGKGMNDAIKSIYANEILENLIEINSQENGYKICGFIAKPNSPAIKFNRNFQTFIVNGRIINDNTLSAVVKNAYNEYLMKRTFPIFIIDIVMPFEEIDVNVHPNKKEVRFAKESIIKRIIYSTIKNVLDNKYKENQKDFLTIRGNNSFDMFPNKFENEDVQQKKIKDIYIDDEKNLNINEDEISKKLSYLSKMSPKINKNKDSTFYENKEICFDINEENIKQVLDYKIIGQVFDTYIIVEKEDDLFYIDQHAAHERIIYNQFLEKLENDMDIQDLLLPYKYNIENNYDFFNEKKDVFKKMGIEYNIVDQNEIEVVAIPLILSDMDLDKFFNYINEEFVLTKSIKDISLIKSKIAKAACRSAIKGGCNLEKDDIKYVLDYFFEKGMPLQCPHGRPTIIKTTKKQLEKLFGRIL